MYPLFHGVFRGPTKPERRLSARGRIVVADVVQLMATGEPSLVAGAAALLEMVLRHDGDALPRLYTTGAFFFALAYCGSNLLEVARLLRVSFLGRLLSLSAAWPCRQPDEGTRCSQVTDASIISGTTGQSS